MGLFGLSPEDVQTLQQQQDTQHAMGAAQLPRGSGGVYASSIAGNLIGRGVAGAMGYENPQMVKAKKFQQAMQETEAAGIDYQKDPESYMGLGIKNLIKYGLHEQAFAMQDKLYQVKQRKLISSEGYLKFLNKLMMEKRLVGGSR